MLIIGCEHHPSVQQIALILRTTTSARQRCGLRVRAGSGGFGNEDIAQFQFVELVIVEIRVADHRLVFATAIVRIAVKGFRGPNSRCNKLGC